MTKEEYNAYMRKYRAKNKDKIKEIAKRSYENNKEKRFESNRKYYHKLKAEGKLNYYQKNIKSQREYRRELYKRKINELKEQGIINPSYVLRGGKPKYANNK